MKNVIGTLVAVAGLAAAAHAQTSIFDVQVRTGGGAWGSSVDVTPGTTVEARVLVSYNQGNGAAANGLAAANFQPTISNWTAGDAVLPFLNQGTSPATGGVEDASGAYGRVLPYAAPGISAANQLIVHQNNVGGVNYARIAQTPTTNWFGSGTLANNLNGSGSITTGQKSQSLTTPADPAYSTATQDLVLFKFAFTVDANSDIRTMLQRRLRSASRFLVRPDRRVLRVDQR
mgnify:CR=1 FL=1